MATNFRIDEIYDKNINFLIGSGASYGLFPTLALNIKSIDGEDQSIETLATLFDAESNKELFALVFMHYYKSCIEPVMKCEHDKYIENDIFNIYIKESTAIENYIGFIETILNILQQSKTSKRCNVFTTNYDTCFSYAADRVLNTGNVDFIINDGSRGFSKRYLQAKNFNSFICQTGIFGRHHTEIPQINLIHLHGSVYWYKSDDNIVVDYSKENIKKRLIHDGIFKKLDAFSKILLDDKKTISNLKGTGLSDQDIDIFWAGYKELPIVNPTKWKFHETVFEEHYYQMLRLMSYELEKPNSIFITFGFSFADEHIRNLVKRSLSNPSLQLYICCFNNIEKQKMEHHFNRYKNVEYLIAENDSALDFTYFNSQIFTSKKNYTSSTNFKEAVAL